MFWEVLDTTVAGEPRLTGPLDVWWAAGPFHVHWASVADTSVLTPCCAARLPGRVRPQTGRASGWGGVHAPPDVVAGLRVLNRQPVWSSPDSA